MLFRPQMGVVAEASIQTKGTFTAQENVDFSDQMQPYVYNAGGEMDPTRSLQDTNDATLDNFFSRPLKIHEVEWGTGTSLFSSIDPWTLYFENPRVINRLVNYKLLKAKLHVKLVMNGNGFQYGRAIASYLPYNTLDSLSTSRALIAQDLVQESQRPHVYLDPTTSSGGEMILPMFWYTNYLDIPDTDWNKLGSLTIRSINDLKHANGASDRVTVSVFAWAEDVSFSVLTAHEPVSLAPQMGEIDEANRSGVISKPASVIAKCAGALKDAPMIAPFALATEMAASTVGNIAKMFGYSRPPVTKAPDPFVPRPFGQLALTNVPDNCFKLTVDEKQELSIDARIAGLSGGLDPLNIRDIASRESYLTTFSWNIGTAPETILWNARIDPAIWAEVASNPKELHLPACAMACLPFKYWTGSMKFRFQIVCSSFHKGRLKVVYDPDYIATNEYNTNYLHIVDIADTKDFTIEIGNGQNRTLLDHHIPGVDSVTQMYSTTQYTHSEVGNGVIGLYVVNELTTPNSTVTNDIEINVFVSMGDDFEVFVPDDQFQRYVYKPQMGSFREDDVRESTPLSLRSNRIVHATGSRSSRPMFEPQSGKIVPESENTTEPSAPLHDDTVKLGPTLQGGELINKVFTGECITSFRQMLKRYNLHSCVGLLNSAPVMLQLQMAAFPYLRGAVTGAIHQTTAFADYNFCNTVMLHWVTHCFSAWRGSIRWKAVNRAFQVERSGPRMEVTRFHDSAIYSNVITTPFTDYATESQAADSVVVETPGSGILAAQGKPSSATLGSAITVGEVNPTLEWEIPFYSSFRHAPGKKQDWTSYIPFGGSLFTTWCNPDASSTVDFYCAAGEDYVPYFWTGCPVIYYEANPPDPVII